MNRKWTPSDFCVDQFSRVEGPYRIRSSWLRQTFSSWRALHGLLGRLELKSLPILTLS